MTVPTVSTYKFPRCYHYPPFFTRQPTIATRNVQLAKWSSLILSYCRHHRLWRLSVVDAINTPLFHNTQLKKRLSLVDARDVLDWMTSKEGGERAEWVGKEGEKAVCWIYWRRPAEWAEVLSDWVCVPLVNTLYMCTDALVQVDGTGQKNTVLTLYELTEGETTMSQGG